jgi:hypothetical protein
MPITNVPEATLPKDPAGFLYTLPSITKFLHLLCLEEAAVMEVFGF